MRSKAAVALLFAAVVGMPWRSAADSEESFRRGFQALDRKRYNEAAGHMRDAIRERPVEGGEPVRISGSFFSPYLPHYYLGVALFRNGDCAGALKEWRESEQQKVVAGTSEAGTLKALKGQCLGPQIEKEKKAAEAELENAHRRDRELRDVMAGPKGREILGGNTGFVQRTRNAEEQLAEADKKLAEGKTKEDPESLAAARDLAVQAARQFQELTDQAASLIASAPPPVQIPVTPARPETGPKPVPQTPPPATTTPPPVSTPPPKPADQTPVPERDKLRSAAGAFFAGDYEAALRALRNSSFSEDRIQAQAALFSAASRMALYWLGGGRDAALLAQAQGDVRRCKRLDRRLRLPKTAFSPRFIAFFDAVR